MSANPRGVAMPLVLFITTLLAICITALTWSNRQHSQVMRLSSAQVQAHFIARAGVQHTLLKIRHLQRELYDAVCLAQGRNPLFDFSQPAGPYNLGPVFLIHKGEAAAEGSELKGIDSALTDVRNPPRRWLEVYRSDLVSGGTVQGRPVNRCLDFSGLPANIRGLMREPFKGAYRVVDLGVAVSQTDETAAQGVRNQAVVEMTVEAEVESPNGSRYSERLKNAVRVSRQ